MRYAKAREAEVLNVGKAKAEVVEEAEAKEKEKEEAEEKGFAGMNVL